MVQRIDSVLNQTFQDFEIILLDDGSTDTSIDILHRYASHPKISYFEINKTNSGSTFSQWEKGISHAKGAYIWIAETDDYAAPDFLEQMLSVITSSPKIGLAYSDAYILENCFFNEMLTFSVMKNVQHDTNYWNSNYIVDGVEEMRKNLFYFNSINNASSVLFRKSAIESSAIFDIKFRYLGDWFAYLSIATKYQIAYCHLPLNYYRVHGNNTSKVKFKNGEYIIELFKLYNWILKFQHSMSIKEAFLKLQKHNVIKCLWKNPYQYLSLSIINPRLFLDMLYYNYRAKLNDF